MAHLRVRALSLDALPATRKAELVVTLRGALDEVGVLESLLAQGALEQRVWDRVGDGGGSDTLLGGTTIGRTVPRARDPPSRDHRRAGDCHRCYRRRAGSYGDMDTVRAETSPHSESQGQKSGPFFHFS